MDLGITQEALALLLQGVGTILQIIGVVIAISGVIAVNRTLGFPPVKIELNIRWIRRALHLERRQDATPMPVSVATSATVNEDLNIELGNQKPPSLEPSKEWIEYFQGRIDNLAKKVDYNNRQIDKQFKSTHAEIKRTTELLRTASDQDRDRLTRAIAGEDGEGLRRTIRGLSWIVYGLLSCLVGIALAA